MTSHPLDRLEPRGKPPATVRALETWIQQAQRSVGVSAGRLGWMVASEVVIAALQRALHEDGQPRFLVKGGTYLELRLGLRARATRDVDTMFRGRFDDFLDVLDEVLAVPFDGIDFRRTETEPIDVPGRLTKPRRFEVRLQLRGRTWRRIAVEVAPDEGRAGVQTEQFSAPSLAHFGLTTPPSTAGILIDYQVAQKLHACTDPHTPERPNDRVRDVVDLHLLKSAFYNEPVDLTSLAEACQDLFEARAFEAEQTGVEPRDWPPRLIGHRHWQHDYSAHADEVSLRLTLDQAVAELNAWLEEIARAAAH
jgi:hypothetical protein